jgi:hypothetical protein
MLNKNITLTLEHIISAERDCQSMTPESEVSHPKTQIGLPERLLARTTAEAASMGLSAEVLIIALLQMFHGADEPVKMKLSADLNRLRHPGGA